MTRLYTPLKNVPMYLPKLIWNGINNINNSTNKIFTISFLFTLDINCL